MKLTTEKNTDSLLKPFIGKHKDLFWSVSDKDKENLSAAAVLETVLNYAELPVISELFEILSVEEAARLFRTFDGRRKGNIYPEIYHFFSKYFEKHASRNTIKRTN